MPFPTNPALEAAVIADCENDLPRLVYADWLDEHGDPARAAFIRTQIALHDKSPADPHFTDLELAQEEAVVPLAGRDLSPPSVPGLLFPRTLGLALVVGHGHFERGFPATALGNVSEWAARQVHHRIPLAETLRRMVTDTTVRGLAFLENWTALCPILSAREIRSLTSFAFGMDNNPGTDDLAMVGRSPMVRHLRRFSLLRGWRPHSGFRTLAGMPFRQLTRLDLPSVAGGRPAVNLFLKAEWVQRLREVRLTVGPGEPADTLLKGLASLPRLHTLHLDGCRYASLAAIKPKHGFAALGKLHLSAVNLRGEQADALAGCRFPRLAVLGLDGSVPTSAVRKLVSADWFPALRSLSISSDQLGDGGVQSLRTASRLRALTLRGAAVWENGLDVIATAFPDLRSLEVQLPSGADQSLFITERFLARLATPHIRDLTLRGIRLPLPAVKALAANPALSNLTLLRLENAGMTAEGVEALVTSPRLQRLIRLDFLGHSITTQSSGGEGLAALLNPAVMPNLVRCGTPKGLSEELWKRLEAARPDLQLA
jgi:uncharacterized protein (TIGR02996 family)